MAWEYGQYIWDNLLSVFQNEYAVAGIMGNMVAESNLLPYIVEGDVISPYSFSQQYTELVDTGEITEEEFVNSHPEHYGAGYGLCQWTFYTRKQGLYDLHISTGYSIGSKQLGVLYVVSEMQNTFPTVYAQLLNAESIEFSSDLVYSEYESIGGSDPEQIANRRRFSQEVYDTYHGSDPPPPPPPPTRRGKMPLWMYLHYGL